MCGVVDTQVEEPFESKQVGSSTMPYKRNPMRSERITALSRFVCSLAENGHQTHANQVRESFQPWHGRGPDSSRLLACTREWLLVVRAYAG